MRTNHTLFEKAIVATLAIALAVAWTNTLVLEYAHPEIRLYDLISTTSVYVAMFAASVLVVLLIQRFYELEALQKALSLKHVAPQPFG